MRVRHVVIGLACAGLAASCILEPRVSLGPAGVSVVQGDAQTDTAGASLRLPLVVDVRDSTGHIVAPGMRVWFTGIDAGVHDTSQTYYGGWMQAMTGAGGQAAAFVELGSVAGTAKVAVFVPDLKSSDTATFTVLPDSYDHVVVSPAETTLYVGGSFMPRAFQADRWGNVRTNPATVTVPPGSGITIASRTITAATYGRYSYDVSSGPGPYTQGFVDVVPHGQIAAWDAANGRILSMEMDGSNVIDRAPIMNGGIGAHPDWMPGSDDVIYTASNGTIQELRVATPGGSVRLFLAPKPASISHQAEPTPTASGNFIYFSAYDTNCRIATNGYCLHRSNVDGTSVVAFLEHANQEVRMPAPSPDGSRVAFWRSASQLISVLRVATDSAANWSVSGSFPVWSRDGQHIAYWSGTALSLMQPNGTQQTALTSTVLLPLSWTDDNEWILTRGSDRLYLVRVSDSSVIPLGYSANLVSASLK